MNMDLFQYKVQFIHVKLVQKLKSEIKMHFISLLLIIGINICIE